MSNNIQKLLNEALQAIATQVISYKNGDKLESWFIPSYGICANVRLYNRFKNIPFAITDKSVMDELEILFYNENLDRKYPFNISSNSYLDESYNNVIWNNFDRLEFIMRYKE